MKKVFSGLLLLLVHTGFSQNFELSVLSIPDSLKESANAVIRNHQCNVEITSRRAFKVSEKKVITVLNELGNRCVDASEYYDNSTSVKEIEAIIYDALGNEVKKIRKKDFRTNSLSEGSVVTDGRIIYLDYTPVQYPYTVVYNSEVVSSNTAFLPKWLPVTDYYLSVMKSQMNVRNLSASKLRTKEKNFSSVIAKSESNQLLSYSCLNAKALRKEDLAPSIVKVVPTVLFALNEFHLEGVDGAASDWSSFGKWMYETLLQGTDELTEETKIKIHSLVGSETDPIKKAEIVYDFVQKNTRYVSIQLGIGGWKPMPAKDVARLGYGDCKALSNYTRALLKEVNVPSYYTIVYGNEGSKVDIEPDFAALQGNHAILGVPSEGEIKWLECTSQVQPFGFQGSFTDSRNVLIVGQDKSEIVKTKTFTENDNIQQTMAKLVLDLNGSLHCTVDKKATGLQYDDRFQIENLSKEELENFYKKQFDNFGTMKIEEMKVVNDRTSVVLTEKLVFSAANFVNLAPVTLFSLNPLHPFASLPSRYKNRKQPFEISRGNKFVDSLTLVLPLGYRIDALPGSVELATQFGLYKLQIQQQQNGEITLKRELTLYAGTFESSKYEEYRKFRESILKNENLKVAIVKT